MSRVYLGFRIQEGVRGFEFSSRAFRVQVLGFTETLNWGVGAGLRALGSQAMEARLMA